MRNVNLASMVAESWEMISTLSGYGTEPLTVGWWRGRAYVHVWDFRRGTMSWKPFSTTRTPTKSPRWNPFESAFLYWALRVR